MSRRILAIAGDCAVGRTCQQRLRPEEYEIKFCEDPTAAVQAAANGDFEALLVCETTSGLDTIQVVRQLREAAVQARVIVLGSNPTVEAAVAAIKEGAADYLHEPCSAEELQAALRQTQTIDAAIALAGGAETAAGWQGFEGMLGSCPAM